MLLNRNGFERALYAVQVGWVRDVFLNIFLFFIEIYCDSKNYNVLSGIQLWRNQSSVFG